MHDQEVSKVRSYLRSVLSKDIDEEGFSCSFNESYTCFLLPNLHGLYQSVSLNQCCGGGERKERGSEVRERERAEKKRREKTERERRGERERERNIKQRL